MAISRHQNAWGWFHSRTQSHFVTQSHFWGKSEPDYGMCELVSFLVSVSICNSVSFQNETGFEAHLLLSLTLRKKKSEQSLKVRPTMKCPKNWAGWSQFENETDQKVRLSYKLRLTATMKSPSGCFDTMRNRVNVTAINGQLTISLYQSSPL